MKKGLNKSIIALSLFLTIALSIASSIVYAKDKEAPKPIGTVIIENKTDLDFTVKAKIYFESKQLKGKVYIHEGVIKKESTSNVDFVKEEIVKGKQESTLLLKNYKKDIKLSLNSLKEGNIGGMGMVEGKMVSAILNVKIENTENGYSYHI